MPLLFDRNSKTVKEIFSDFTDDNLIIDPSYQRRSVWLKPDKVRLIETILLDLIIPEVFFWPAVINSDTGNMVTHVVDGQQRITSIVEFINGDFPLEKKYMMDEAISVQCGDKFFNDLSAIYKEKLWCYKLSIVNIDRSFTKNEITKMFKRLNLTNYSLNKQEIRNSRESSFGDKAEELSNYEFWKKYKVFSALDARRMKDVEYCCSIYILSNEGIIDQTNDKKINEYYDDNCEIFDEDEILLKKIKSSMDIIERICDSDSLSFVSKKAQMYTLFSFSFKLIDENINFSSEIFERFKLFVLAYNLFKNEYTIEIDEPDLREINENIKKYKLASSEGINKMGNRVIRLQTLFNICVLGNEHTKYNLRNLAKIYEEKKLSKINYEEFDCDEDTIEFV